MNGIAGKIILVVFCLAAGPVWAESPLPFAEQINALMAPLEYSGVPLLLRPQVGLSIDFNKRSWTLHQIHEYDQQGRVVLEQGRYGLCAELSAHVRDRLETVIDDNFSVVYAIVNEKLFFPSKESNHIALLMADRKAHETYLIDPSFRQYGRVRELANYTVLSVEDQLGFIKHRLPDDSFLIDQAMPLFIKEGLMVSFAVTSVNGRFDKGNFLLVISVNSAQDARGLDIFVVGRKEGQLQDYQTKFLVDRLLSADEQKALLLKFKIWLKAIEAELA